MRSARVFLAFCVLLFPAGIFIPASSAQTGTTSLHGVVTDRSHAVVAGAKATLLNSAQNFSREMITPSTGEFEFLALPPGTYVLTVEKDGFSKFENPSLQLLVNVPSTLNVVLQVGSVSTQVEVSAQSQTINTTDASLGVAFGENQVKQLPLESRNVPDLLSLQTGVVYTGDRPDIDPTKDTRSGSVNGSHSDQSNVTVDGVPANAKGGYAFTSVLPVTLDSVQEFRVTTSNYGADEGVSSGAQVALVTKSGTNEIHGSAYEYNRNSYFSANDYFIKASQLRSDSPNKPQHLNRNIFGASLGGPIKKDRLFLFLNFEGYRDAESISVARTVPTQALRDGVVQYLCPLLSNGNPDTTTCPGNTVSGLTPGSSYTAPPGYFALSPQQLTQMDKTSGPAGTSLGPNPTVLTFMQKKYGAFLPNDQTTGDLLNTAGYRFAAPTATKKNWYIGKLDYNITRDAKHRLSLSGALANENSDASTLEAPFLPGSPAEKTIVDFNKGIIAGYSAVFTSALVNNFRYGFIRQSVGTIGDSYKPWNYFSAFQQGITYSSTFQRPTHNLTDDISWIHGRHTWQFGFQFAFMRNPESNFNNSFDAGYMNQNWFLNSGLSTTTASPLNPANNNYPAVDSSFQGNYDSVVTSLLGMVTLGSAVYNYQRNGQHLAPNSPVVRHFATDSYEMYAQDVWKLKPSLTLTLGLRYSLFSPPWETNGLQVTPTTSLGDWFNARGVGMAQGLPTNRLAPITYDWSGPANGKRGFYNWDYHNFGPRVAFAWSPGFSSGLLGSLFGGSGKTSIRAGFGIVFDRVGESLVDTFDQNGAFGLSSILNNPSNVETSQTAPRLSDMNVIPQTDYAGNPILLPDTGSGFPKTYPLGNGAITWGLDDKLKTPYSYTIDFAVSRELRSGFSLDFAYVGRLSHRLLAQSDLALPLDIYDKKAGIDYFNAEIALAKAFRPALKAGQTDATMHFDPSQLPANVQQFWRDQIQPIVNNIPYRITGCTGVDNQGNAIVTSTTNSIIFAFDTFCSTHFNDSLGLYKIDFNGMPGFDSTQPGDVSSQTYYFAQGQYTYYSSQFSSLYAWRSVAPSNYHAMEVSLHHRMSHGLQFDFNYTLSKSIDISSNAERVSPGSNASLLEPNSNIINSWNPQTQRGVSSFDLTHQFNANWIFELPFGRGKWIARGANRPLDAFIGGWQLSGLFRLTSGFPISVDNGTSNYPTNFELEGNANQVAPVHSGVYFNTGRPNLFSNGPAAISSFDYAYAGQAGQRDIIRGQGFFTIDMGLAKRWTMPWSEKQSLQFRWEVFNVTNSVRFDVQSGLINGSLGLGSGGSFGNYGGLLTNPRIMQFALRYEF